MYILVCIILSYKKVSVVLTYRHKSNKTLKLPKVKSSLRLKIVSFRRLLQHLLSSSLVTNYMKKIDFILFFYNYGCLCINLLCIHTSTQSQTQLSLLKNSLGIIA